jgi:hypothetical protein
VIITKYGPDPDPFQSATATAGADADYEAVKDLHTKAGLIDVT